MKATIFDIQGFSVHDGPGARTLIFFKGCPLRCFWCCNPESQSFAVELMYRRGNCARCHGCISRKACPYDAISAMDPEEYVTIDRSKCKKCHEPVCVKGCYKNALLTAGKVYALDDLMQRIERDRRFWGDEGGVTLGGGEVMGQHEFAAALLAACHESHIHTAIETCGYARWEHYENVLKNVDWVFVDIKHMDPARHKEGTGVDNRLILDNIARMAERGAECRLIVRVPVIPYFNDDDRNMRDTARFARKSGIDAVNCLPFHRLGASKYEQLDLDYACKDLLAPETELMLHIQSLFHDEGVECFIGGETPF